MKLRYVLSHMPQPRAEGHLRVNGELVVDLLVDPCLRRLKLGFGERLAVRKVKSQLLLVIE